MKFLLSNFFIVYCFVLLGQVNPNYTRVEGYYRSNGTYVKSYYRTLPNQTINDNYTTKPNINPHTGEEGYITPEPDYYRYTLPKNSTNKTSYYSTPFPNSNQDELFDYSTIRKVDAMLEEFRRQNEERKWKKEQEEYHLRIEKETQEMIKDNNLKSVSQISYTGNQASNAGEIKANTSSNKSSHKQVNSYKEDDGIGDGYILLNLIIVIFSVVMLAGRYQQ